MRTTTVNCPHPMPPLPRACSKSLGSELVRKASLDAERTITFFRVPMYVLVVLVGGTMAYRTGHALWWVNVIINGTGALTAFIPAWFQWKKGVIPLKQRYYAQGADLLCTVVNAFLIASFAPQYETFAFACLVSLLALVIVSAGVRLDHKLAFITLGASYGALALYIWMHPGFGRMFFFVVFLVAEWMAVVTERIMRRAAERDALARFLPKEVAERIANDPEGLALGGVAVEDTVMFTDMRGFTTLSATQNPEEVMALLNELHAVQVQAVFDEGGTVNKFTGDGLLAVFGAPKPHPDATAAAVRAALKILQGVQDVSTRRGEDVRVGIGLHRGNVVAGNVGSQHQLEYTVIGDTVNVAARLEPLTKEYGVDLLLSRQAANHLNGHFTLRDLGETLLRGHPTPIHLVTLTG